MKQEKLYWDQVKSKLSEAPPQVFREEDWLLLADRLPQGKRKRNWWPIWLSLLALLFLSQQESRLAASSETELEVVSTSDQLPMAKVSIPAPASQDEQVEPTATRPADITPIRNPKQDPSLVANRPGKLKYTDQARSGSTGMATSDKEEVSIPAFAAENAKPNVPEKIAVTTLARLPLQSLSHKSEDIEWPGNTSVKLLPESNDKSNHTDPRKWGLLAGIAFPTEQAACFEPRFTIGLLRERQWSERWRVRASAAYHWWTYTCADSANTVLAQALPPVYSIAELVSNEVRGSEGSIGIDLHYLLPFAEGRNLIYFGLGTDVGFLQRYRTRSRYRDPIMPETPIFTAEYKGKGEAIYWRQARLSAGVDLRLKGRTQLFLEAQYAWKVADNIYQTPYRLQWTAGIKF